jgi:small-conductance mechanosensitive channel
VHYASDLERVERVTLEVAREVMRSVPGGSAGADPLVRFSAFGDSAIVYNAILRAASFDRGRGVQHEFIKRLTDRFRGEGIVIPFPIRTLDIPADAAAALRGAAAPPAART